MDPGGGDAPRSKTGVEVGAQGNLRGSRYQLDDGAPPVADALEATDHRAQRRADGLLTDKPTPVVETLVVGPKTGSKPGNQKNRGRRPNDLPRLYTAGGLTRALRRGAAAQTPEGPRASMPTRGQPSSEIHPR